MSKNTRIEIFRKTLAAEIPCWPDSSELKAELSEMQLIDLLMIYMNWKDRFIPPRVRQAMEWDGFWERNNPCEYELCLNHLISLINEGADLTPYLSDKILTQGYVGTNTATRKKNAIVWKDKDYALNGFDIHHLHLSNKIRNDGFCKRTNELLFVGVSREEILLIFLGDHKSFDDGSLANACATWKAKSGRQVLNNVTLARHITTKESNRLARNGISTLTETGGKVVLGASLSTAGTSLYHRQHADEVCETIYEIDSRLNKKTFVQELFIKSKKKIPDCPNWQWIMHDCDLMLLERKSNVCFFILKWRR